MGAMNDDEFDTLMDLIVMVMFMGFAFYSLVIMSQHMAKRVDLYTPIDKIIVDEEIHERDDPTWFTGYQAYMFAWHMDEMSDQSLSWVTYNSGAKIDDNNYSTDITMSKNKINDSSIASSFIPLRNRYIVGTGFAEGSNVRSVINNSAPHNLFDLYRGKYYNAEGKSLMYHLLLTDKYTRYRTLGSDINAGGKEYSWVLEPVFR